ncbi:MAG: TonB-dependent receptor [Bacteroidota bacterium]
MKLLKASLPIFFLLSFSAVWAQTSGVTQTIRGKVFDRQAEVPLTGATIQVIGVEPVIGAYSDESGAFALKGVPVGRQIVQVKYLGYEDLVIPNVLVTGGKEVQLELGLIEALIQAEEVVISGTTSKDKAQNELATVSARTFSLEEVTRYAGARTDVARMASNFAGVSTPDDSRNDIVIRGNSPTAVLWRLEGIPIPNPNHFSTLGTTGGPVSALNTNMLKNSDFLTGAFPAEYGNALGGVFDIGLRTGNPEKFEFTGQIGAFSGAEFMAEGPLNKANKGSFAASYRYSFVGIGSELGIPIGTEAVPQYQDLTFNLDLGYGKAGRFSIFGIGGLSSIDFLGNEIDEDDLFANPNEDAFPRSQFGVIGLKHNILLGEKAYWRTVVSTAISRNEFNQDNLLDSGDKLRATESENVTNTYSISSFINQKISPRLTLRTGILAEIFDLDIFTRDRDNRPDRDGDGIPDWVTVQDFEGTAGLWQAYAQAQYRISNTLTLNAGLHGQYLDLNETTAFEPRLALNWKFQPNQTISLAYGLHNQMQPLPVYFFTLEEEDGSINRTNEDLDFTQSQHFVLGYDLRAGQDWRIKVETYYQDLSNVAVESTPSSFSVLNEGNGFVFTERGDLVNEGIGTNYGLEFTLEKFFSRGYYGLLTTSLYESTYEGSDGIERNTAFNNGFIFNFLAGKEWKIGASQQNAFTVDIKFTTAGGRYYTPVDLAATRANFGREILNESQAFSEQEDPYLRLDTKFGFRLNSRKKQISHQFYIDLQNVTNQENVFLRRYSEFRDDIVAVNQIGFFPDILYRIQF